MSGLPDRPTPIPQSAFSASFGGTLISGFFAIFLFGISVLQTYMYYMRYLKDTVWLKLLVLFITILATAQVILLGILIYRFLVVSYTEPSVLGSGAWPIYVGAIINYIIVVVVQAYFARMIYHLIKGAKKYLLLVGFAVFILSEFAFGMCWVIKEFQSKSLADLVPWIPKLLVPLRVLRMLSDATTTLALCLVLFDAKVRFKPSMKIVRTIIIYAVNRFVLTTIIGTIQTIIMAVNPHSISALSIDYIAVHLYINSFLAALNARNRVRANAMGASSYLSTSEVHPTRTNVNLPGMATEHSNIPEMPISHTGQDIGQVPRKGVRINVETESYMMRDIESPEDYKGDQQHAI